MAIPSPVQHRRAHPTPSDRRPSDRRPSTTATRRRRAEGAPSGILVPAPRQAICTRIPEDAERDSADGRTAARVTDRGRRERRRRRQGTGTRAGPGASALPCTSADAGTRARLRSRRPARGHEDAGGCRRGAGGRGRAAVGSRRGLLSAGRRRRSPWTTDIPKEFTIHICKTLTVAALAVDRGEVATGSRRPAGGTLAGQATAVPVDALLPARRQQRLGRQPCLATPRRARASVRARTPGCRRARPLQSFITSVMSDITYQTKITALYCT